jgi:hypothetical protein
MAARMKGKMLRKSFNLTVAEVGSKDVGRRIARIDPKGPERLSNIDWTRVENILRKNRHSRLKLACQTG